MNNDFNNYIRNIYRWRRLSLVVVTKVESAPSIDLNQPNTHSVLFGDVCKVVADCSLLGRNSVCDFARNLRVCKCNAISEINEASDYCVLISGSWRLYLRFRNNSL